MFLTVIKSEPGVFLLQIYLSKTKNEINLSYASIHYYVPTLLRPIFPPIAPSMINDSTIASITSGQLISNSGESPTVDMLDDDVVACSVLASTVWTNS